MDQGVSDSDYPGLNSGPPICGHMGLSHSLHKNGHEGLNQDSEDIQKGLNTNILNENQDRVNIECSDQCECSNVKLIYITKYCGQIQLYIVCKSEGKQRGLGHHW